MPTSAMNANSMKLVVEVVVDPAQIKVATDNAAKIMAGNTQKHQQSEEQKEASHQNNLRRIKEQGDAKALASHDKIMSDYETREQIRQKRMLAGHTSWSQKMSTGINSIAFSIKAMAAAWATAKLSQIVGDAFRLTGELVENADAVGVSVTKYYSLVQAGAAAGVSMEQLSRMITKLNIAAEKQGNGRTGLQLMDDLLRKMASGSGDIKDVSDLLGTKMTYAFMRLSTHIKSADDAYNKWGSNFNEAKLRKIEEASDKYEVLIQQLKLFTGEVGGAALSGLDNYSNRWSHHFEDMFDGFREIGTGYGVLTQQATDYYATVYGFLKNQKDMEDLLRPRTQIYGIPTPLPRTYDRLWTDVKPTQRELPKEHDWIRPGISAPGGVGYTPMGYTSKPSVKSDFSVQGMQAVTAAARQVQDRLSMIKYLQDGIANGKFVNPGELQSANAMLDVLLGKLTKMQKYSIVQGGGSSMATALFDLQSAQTQSEIQGLELINNAEAERWQNRSDMLRASGLETSAMYRNELRQAQDAEKKREKSINKLKAKAFDEEKNARRISVVMNTADAIIRTLAQFGFTPWGIVAAGMAAATGAIQLATISEQKNPYRGMREGGWVGGRPFDDNPIMASRGEHVTPRSQARNNAEALNYIRAGGIVHPRGGDTYQIGTVIGNDEWVQNNLIPLLKKAKRQGYGNNLFS